jgi:hypothetical protein
VNKALDTKERSRARKEAVESKRDKKSLALDVLKAKRKEKQELQQKKVATVIALFIQIEIHWFRFWILTLIKYVTDPEQLQKVLKHTCRTNN